MTEFTTFGKNTVNSVYFIDLRLKLVYTVKNILIIGGNMFQVKYFGQILDELDGYYLKQKMGENYNRFLHCRIQTKKMEEAEVKLPVSDQMIDMAVLLGLVTPGTDKNKIIFYEEDKGEDDYFLYEYGTAGQKLIRQCLRKMLKTQEKIEALILELLGIEERLANGKSRMKENLSILARKELCLYKMRQESPLFLRMNHECMEQIEVDKESIAAKNLKEREIYNSLVVLYNEVSKQLLDWFISKHYLKEKEALRSAMSEEDPSLLNKILRTQRDEISFAEQEVILPLHVVDDQELIHQIMIEEMSDYKTRSRRTKYKIYDQASRVCLRFFNPKALVFVTVVVFLLLVVVVYNNTERSWDNLLIGTNKSESMAEIKAFYQSSTYFNQFNQRIEEMRDISSHSDVKLQCIISRNKAIFLEPISFRNPFLDGNEVFRACNPWQKTTIQKRVYKIFIKFREVFTK